MRVLRETCAAFPAMAKRTEVAAASPLDISSYRAAFSSRFPQTPYSNRSMVFSPQYMYAMGHRVPSASAATLSEAAVPNCILIVDDSVAVRRLTREYLELHCDSVVCDEASDGLEAIFKAEERAPDLIVMDLSMPRMNGLEAARILKSKTPHIPIVLFTMHENAIRRCDADLADVTVVVSKDKLDVLLAEVRTILNLAQCC